MLDFENRPFMMITLTSAMISGSVFSVYQNDIINIRNKIEGKNLQVSMFTETISSLIFGLTFGVFSYFWYFKILSNIGLIPKYVGNLTKIAAGKTTVNEMLVILNFSLLSPGETMNKLMDLYSTKGKGLISLGLSFAIFRFLPLPL